MADTTNGFDATGRRKTAVARVRLIEGSGDLKINGRPMADYFPTEALRKYILQPFDLTGTADRFCFRAWVKGGGTAGQAGAVRHGLSRALVAVDVSMKEALKSSGCLTRDPRMKERKKPGQPGARKRFQFSKR